MKFVDSVSCLRPLILGTLLKKHFGRYDKFLQ